jgi:hypothetical protein
MNSAADFSELIIPLGSAIEAHDGAGTYEGEIGFSEIISINDDGHYTRCKRPYDERITGIESGDRGSIVYRRVLQKDARDNGNLVLSGMSS